VKDVLLNAVGRAAEKKRLTDEKRRLEQEIKRYAEELEMRVDERTAELVETHKRLVQQERIAALGRAAAQVAHEVKNPLAGLLLYSLHLKSKSDKFSESEASLVDKIVDTINHLINRVEQILSFARPVSLKLRSGDLKRTVNHVLELLRPQLTANKVEVRLAMGSEEAIAVFDESSMRGALMNLILNAIESMREGGTLSIAIDRTAEKLQLEITDTGRGISDEDVKQIFEPFFTTKEQGLGLGMPYAKKIIEQHGGAISLSSRAGAGTTVCITLAAGQKEFGHAS
jgi:signal transduction histidine kinase